MNELPPIGECKSVEGGVITRWRYGRFEATTPTGQRVYFNRCEAKRPEVAFRRAENALRTAANLPLLPQLCIRCLSECSGKNDYCGGVVCPRTDHAESRVNRNAQAEAFFNSLTRAEILARAQAAAGPERERKQISLPAQGKTFSYSDLDLRRFTIALDKADELIRRRGGIVPRRETFDEYLTRYQQATTVKTEAS